MYGDRAKKQRRRLQDVARQGSSREVLGNDTGPSLRVVDVGATITSLDPNGQGELRNLLETGVSYPSVATEPGMHYLDQKGKIAIARQKMAVTMAIGAVPPPPSTAFVDDEGQPCGEICLQDGQISERDWLLTTFVAPRWTYVTQDESAFTVHAEPSDVVSTQAGVLWKDGKWLFDPQYGLGYACGPPALENRLASEAAGAGLNGSTFYTYKDPTTGSDNPTNGCLLEFSLQDNAGAQALAQVLYRFGVALAANSDAQRLFPELPVSSAAERALAQTIRAGTVQ
jgi:hypothetical protein